MASGLIHNVGPDDVAALDLVRTYLGYFPSSAWSYPRDLEGGDAGFRAVPELLDIVPRNGRRVYDMRDVIDVVFDEGSCFEVQPGFGRSLICCPGPPRRPPRRRGGQPAAGPCRLDRRRRRRQRRPTSSLSPTRSTSRWSSSPTTRGSCRAASPSARRILRSGARMYAAQTQARVPEVHGHPAQGLRVRLDGHGDDPLRRPVSDVRLSRRHHGRHGGGGDEPGPGSDVDEASLLRQTEVEASYRSARELRPGRADQPGRNPRPSSPCARAGLYRRQATPEPAARIAIMP